MRTVLVFAYYFPPMGLSGVQRVAKLVKYLPEFGWRPHVITTEPGGYFAFDPTLEAEVQAAGVVVHRASSLDPTRLFGKKTTVGLPRESRRRRLAALSQWMFVPDNKVGWMPAALRLGQRLIEYLQPDVLFSSAPPYTSHLIASRLARKNDVPLLLDFRDDWVGNPRHTYPTGAHAWLHDQLEWRCLSAADRILVINETIRQSLLRHDGRRRTMPPVEVVTQGYDPADFKLPSPPPRPGFDLLYTGVFYDVQQPDTFLHGLQRFLDQRPEARDDVCARFVGIMPERLRDLAVQLGVDDLVVEHGYVAHGEAVEHLQRSTVLWMTIGRRPGAEGISTGKLYEYMGARKPILALVPKGEAQQTLATYPGSVVVPPDDPSRVAEALEQLYTRWSRGKLVRPAPEDVEPYDRIRIAQQVGRLMDQL